jgi:hypothetical protein
MDLKYNRRFRQPPSNLAAAIQFWATLFSIIRKILAYKMHGSAKHVVGYSVPTSFYFPSNSFCEVLELNPALIRRKLLAGC